MHRPSQKVSEKMAEYIKREDAIDICTKCVDFQDSIENINASAEAMRIRRLIREMPSADVVERKHGKWKYQTMVHESGMKASGVKCSICGATYNLSITLPDMMVEALNFCPNCGARMESEEEE